MKRYITTFTFFKKICALPFVNAIYLFGSRARGDHSERSDIDLAINCTGATKSQWHEILRIIEEQHDTLLGIDCVRLDTLKDELFLTAINNAKTLLYKKGSRT